MKISKMEKKIKHVSDEIRACIGLIKVANMHSNPDISPDMFYTVLETINSQACAIIISVNKPLSLCKKQNRDPLAIEYFIRDMNGLLEELKNHHPHA